MRWRMSTMRELLCALEDGRRAAFFQKRASQFDALLQIGRAFTHAEREPRVERDDVGSRGLLAAENPFKCFAARVDGAAAKLLQRRTDSVILRLESPASTALLVERVHGRRPFAADLVDTAGCVHH